MSFIIVRAAGSVFAGCVVGEGKLVIAVCPVTRIAPLSSVFVTVKFAAEISKADSHKPMTVVKIEISKIV